ncbi:MAG: hypothetical protein LBJ00_04005 [Planctomycetaceae bacterium]|nr:hypothetical protein [Planctomycetaceae bacterium]
MKGYYIFVIVHRIDLNAKHAKDHERSRKIVSCSFAEISCVPKPVWAML